MRTFTGRTALVTGAAGGIGRALCAELETLGCRVVAADLPSADLSGVGTVQIAADVTCWDDWQRLAEATPEAAILVNNAGLTVHSTLADMGPEQIDAVLDVNLKGVVYGCRALLPALRAQDEAHIVNLSSLAALLGIPSQSTYCASKWGVRGFSASLRLELSGTPVGVTAVLPGAVATPFLSAATSSDPGLRDRLSGLMLRHGMPPAAVVRSILRGVRRNRAEVVVGWQAHSTSMARSVAPSAVHAILGAAWRRWGR